MSCTPVSIALLLQCPLCPPNSLLVSPVTLRCGHTVCAEHVLQNSSLCPLPVCPPPLSDSRVGLRIHSASNVVFQPAAASSAPPDLDQPHHSEVVDIVVNKLIDIVSRFMHTQPDPVSRDVEHDDQSGSDDNIDVPDVLPKVPPYESIATTQGRTHSRSNTDSDSSQCSVRRPAKRRRHNIEFTDNIPSLSSQPQPEADVDDDNHRFEKELLSELTCEICFVLFYQPVTTPCQHSFCAKCLQRSMDHNSQCPVCRTTLPDYAFFQDHPCNKVVLSIVLKAYPEAYAERGRAIEEEERDARLDTPIFICQLAFPGVPTVLHFFEPRYRLMLRRCLESPTPQFGMVMPPRDTASTMTLDFGTMLRIRTVKMLPDGRSMVYTSGVSRFRIMEKGSLDGYMVGRIELIEDYAEELDNIVELEEPSIEQALQEYSVPSSAPTLDNVAERSNTSNTAASSTAASPSSLTVQRPLPSANLMSNEDLMRKCLVFVEELREGAAPWVVNQLNSYGAMPTDPASFTFWMALVLPIDDTEKAKLLPIKSPRLRLRLVVHWIDQLKSHWWFENGCIIA